MTSGERIELDKLFHKAKEAKRLGLRLDRQEDKKLFDLWLKERDEIDAMLQKQAEAHAMNMDLNESDKSHLLDLLLIARIREAA